MLEGMRYGGSNARLRRLLPGERAPEEEGRFLLDGTGCPCKTPLVPLNAEAHMLSRTTS
jgi:hypothetical protein